MKKSEKFIDIIFIAVIFLIIIIPLLFMKKSDDAISKDENRKLTEKPKIINKDGNINFMYLQNLETWFNDSFGFREEIINNYANFQYKAFGKFIDNDYYIGKHGELAYATEEMLLDYQHLNLKTKEENLKIAKSIKKIQNWLKKQKTDFYYVQCYDKHSIYPEEFIDYVYVNGEYSKTDNIVNSLKEKNVNVISLKESLLKEKEKNRVFGTWYDPGHWNYRGAYVGYIEVMRVLNEHNNKYYVLNEDNFNIYWTDQGKTINKIHKADYEPIYELKKANAIEQTNREELGKYAQDSRNKIYVNEHVKNNKTIVIICDSYFGSYITEFIAESFYKTYVIWADYIYNLPEFQLMFKPDIFIYESAERCDRTKTIVDLTEN